MDYIVKVKNDNDLNLLYKALKDINAKLKVDPKNLLLSFESNENVDNIKKFIKVAGITKFELRSKP